MKPTDNKELLELAAKACGFTLQDCTCKKERKNSATGKHWNPLTDDGDRYRLAKKLGFVIDFELSTVQCNINGEPFIFQWGGILSEEKAFVLAAAEIGKAIP